MGPNKSIYHPNKFLVMPLVNKPLKLEITIGFPPIPLLPPNHMSLLIKTLEGQLAHSVPLIPPLPAQTTWVGVGVGGHEPYS